MMFTFGGGWMVFVHLPVWNSDNATKDEITLAVHHIVSIGNLDEPAACAVATSNGEGIYKVALSRDECLDEIRRQLTNLGVSVHG